MPNSGSETAQIIQLVPRLPPEIDGVGDYAAQLAAQLRQDRSIDTRFIVGDPEWEGLPQATPFPVQTVPTRSAKALSALLSGPPPVKNSGSTVLLHYSNYGYAQRGCPVWLVAGLERWKTTQTRLITLFHELYASGQPPWTSSFWFSPLQRNLALRLVKLSDRCLTSTQGFAQALHQLSPSTPITPLPVFSSIGEPQSVPPLAERPPKLVVFGQAATRLRVYEKSLAALQQVCQSLEIEEIYDLGPPIHWSSQVGGIPVTGLGQQPAAQVSRILLHSRAGFFDYFHSSLAKSTIFAAYCAHGLLPVGTFDQPPPLEVDGLMAAKHYWLASDTRFSLSLPMAQAIADQAHTWYQTHTLAVQAQVFAAQLIDNRSLEVR